MQDSGGGALLAPTSSSSSKRGSTDIAHDDVKRMVTKKRAGSPASMTTPTSSMRADDIPLAVKQVLAFQLQCVK